MLKKISRVMLFSWALVSSVFDASADDLYTKILLDNKSTAALESKLSSVMASISDKLKGKIIHPKDYWHMSLMPICVPCNEQDLIYSKQDESKLGKYGIKLSLNNDFEITIPKKGPSKAPGKRSQLDFLDDLNKAYKCRTNILPMMAGEILSKIQNLTFKINRVKIFTGIRGDFHVALQLVPDLSSVTDLNLRKEIEDSILEQVPHISLAKYSIGNSSLDIAALQTDMNALNTALANQNFDDIDLSFDFIHVEGRAGSIMKAKFDHFSGITVF